MRYRDKVVRQINIIMNFLNALSKHGIPGLILILRMQIRINQRSSFKVQTLHMFQMRGVIINLLHRRLSLNEPRNITPPDSYPDFHKAPHYQDSTVIDPKSLTALPFRHTTHVQPSNQNTTVYLLSTPSIESVY